MISGPAPVPWLAFTLKQQKHVGLIAFGVGITEALPVAWSQLLKPIDIVERVILLWGNKTWMDVFWQEQLQELVQQHAGRFQVVHALSREHREGCVRSRIDQPLLDTTFQVPHRGWKLHIAKDGE